MFTHARDGSKLGSGIYVIVNTWVKHLKCCLAHAECYGLAVSIPFDHTTPQGQYLPQQC